LRYLGAKFVLLAGLVFAALLGLEVFTGALALAATNATATAAPVPITALSANPVLTQSGTQSDATWTTTVELDTMAICPVPASFDLVTTSPYSDTPDSTLEYIQGTHAPAVHCSAQGMPPVTEVTLTFKPALSAVPEAATLSVTPPATALKAGAVPLDITLTVHRQVSLVQYLWIPIGCGLLLALLFVGGAMLIGVPRTAGRPGQGRWVRFWRMPLYAAGAWSFGDSWATNVASLGTIIGATLTATASVAALLPGVEVGRFSLLIVLAGGITVVAPLAFSALNSGVQAVDPTTAEVAAIWLPRGTVAVLRGGVRGWLSRKMLGGPLRRRLFRWLAGRYQFGGEVVVISEMPEKRTLDKEMPGSRVPLKKFTTVWRVGGKVPDAADKAVPLNREWQAVLPDGGQASAKCVTITAPAGASVTVYEPVTVSDGTALKSGDTLAVQAGATITVSAPSSGVSGPWWQVLALPGGSDIVVNARQRITVHPAVADGDTAAAPPKRCALERIRAALNSRARAENAKKQADSSLEVKEGAKISFLGRASISLPAGTCIEAPGAQPDQPPRRSALSFQREFAIPHTGEVVAAEMWTMLAASFLTVFGIGAEIGIVGWVLGYDLAVGPQWVRVFSAVVAGVAAALVLGYGISAIRALADTREGTALSSAQGSSFML
jgi:hypothetical protein